MPVFDIASIPPQATWPIRQQVMWPDKPLDYVKLDQDDQGLHLGLKVEGKLVSIISAFIRGNEAQFRKFATLTEEQGKGYGSHLLSYLIAELEEQGIEKIWCNARQEKAGFYARFGLMQTAKTFSRGGIKYVIMEKRRTPEK